MPSLHRLSQVLPIYEAVLKLKSLMVLMLQLLVLLHERFSNPSLEMGMQGT